MRSFKISVVKTLMVFIVMLMLGTNSFAQVSVTLPSVTGLNGSTVTTPITVSTLPAGVTAYQFTLLYDKTKLYILDAQTAGTLSSGGTITVNADTANGRLLVAWASATALSGSGSLVNLVVQFRAAGSSSIYMTGSTFQFNAGTPTATVTGGTLTSSPLLISTGNVSVKLSETILIPVTTSDLSVDNNVTAFNFTATYDPAILNVTGVVTTGALGSGGTVSYNANNTTGSVQVAWASASAIVGNGTLLYLQATPKAIGTSNVTITAFQYNAGVPTAAIAAAAGVVTVSNTKPAFSPKTGTFTVNENSALAFNVVAVDPDPGQTLTYTSSALPTGATLSSAGAFAWTPAYGQHGTYTIQFYATDGIASDTLTTTINVTYVNRAPSLAFQSGGPAFTVAEGSALTITLVGTDPDAGNTLQYSMTSTPAATGAVLSSAGVFTWTPDYTQSGTYTVVFTVADYMGTTALGGSATLTATITVTNTNRPPVWVNTIPAGTIVPVVKAPTPVYYTYTYKATDPDNQTLTYSLIAGPGGASITAAGVFSWSPALADAGKTFVVTVQATDGVATIESTVLLMASSVITGVEEESGVPTDYVLMQNYPNPFNPTTTIRFGLPKDSNVRLSVFNILGQEVTVLVNKQMSAGYQKIEFDASKLTSGLYIYRIQADNFVQIKKMLLMK